MRAGKVGIKNLAMEDRPQMHSMEQIAWHRQVPACEDL